MKVVNYLILITGFFAVYRILVGLILANVHQLKYSKKQTTINQQYLLSVVIPAYNEAKTIEQCVNSVLNQSYLKRQIIIVDDGSSDKTLAILQKIKQRLLESRDIDTLFDHQIPFKRRFIIVHQTNAGKSMALNNGIRNYAIGDLITVLDADSQLKRDAAYNMVKHFQNNKLIAMADNVRIAYAKNLIELVQMVEYLLGYRLKGSEQMLNLEYIIGGIGSTFRRQALEAINFYDNDTVTEDIDITLKLLQRFGNRHWQIGYAQDVIAYTPPVHNFRQLLKQRFRWKLGRFQAIFKHHQLFFNSQPGKYSLTLTWWKLPKVLIEESFILFDPFFLLWMIGIVIIFLDWTIPLTILICYLIFGLVSFMTEKMSLRKRILLSLISPFCYLLLYIINIVDFISLIRCIKNYRQIIAPAGGSSKWEHVDR